MKLLENKNGLPFEAQRHCKLTLEDQKEIRTRYELGETIKDINIDFPYVSSASIRYWAVPGHREQDLQRRKESTSYRISREHHSDAYYDDLNARRKENGFTQYYGPYKGLRENNTAKLTHEEIAIMKHLFEQGYGLWAIQKMMKNTHKNMTKTKMQSYCDNIDNAWYQQAKINRR